jgi:hypothetical protein
MLSLKAAVDGEGWRWAYPIAEAREGFGQVMPPTHRASRTSLTAVVATAVRASGSQQDQSTPSAPPGWCPGFPPPWCRHLSAGRACPQLRVRLAWMAPRAGAGPSSEQRAVRGIGASQLLWPALKG